MSKPKPQRQNPVDQVFELISRLTPEQQGLLRRKLNDTWRQEWRALFSAVDEHNRTNQSLSEEEIISEVKAIRQTMKTERERQSRH